MRKVLITGGAGFIGSNLVRYWLDEYPEDRVIVLDALTYAGNLASLDSVTDRAGFRFVHGDICDQSLVSALLSEEQVDTIIHLAAESHVDRSIVNSQAFIQTNVVGTHTLLEAARAFWLGKGEAEHRFHHVSTDEVFGSLGPDDEPFHEHTPYAPNSPYSASKAASDHLVRAYHHTYGLQTTISNCSNNYGPYQFPEKLIPLMVVNAIEGKSLPVYGDGSNIRDWLFVEDHVKGIDQVIASGTVGESYNLGGEEEHPNLDIVRLLCRIIDRLFADDPTLANRFPNAPAAGGQLSESLIEMVVDRPGHDWRYAVDIRRAARELGFTPSHDLASGLESTVQWMLDNEAWWRSVLDNSYRDAEI
ncbi:MAG: dTDP-glucose 4,6-dehydratase [Pseudomonadota bacterium]